MARMKKSRAKLGLSALASQHKKFTAWGWWTTCACGQAARHTESLPGKQRLDLCESCWFRFQVMRAAGRVDEFIKAEKERRLATLNEDNDLIDILKPHPLPARTGKTLQMYNYLGKPKGKK